MLGNVLGAGLVSRFGERGSRSGGEGSLAMTFPASGTRPGMWLLALTDRRLALWYPALGRSKRLEWEIPTAEFVGAEEAGRVRLVIPAVRLYFRDGSSLKLNAVGRTEFLRHLGEAGWPTISVGVQGGTGAR